MHIVLASLLVIFSFAVTQNQAIQCYICGSGAEQPFKKSNLFDANFGSNSSRHSRTYGFVANETSTTETTNINSINSISKSCDGFDIKSNSLQEFEMECPTLYSGCITVIEGSRTTRTCEMLDVNDCKIANNITYCYCNTDLCNGEQVSILTSRAWKYKDPIENYDDEDFPESSGMNENSYHKRKNKIHTMDDNGHANIGVAVIINHVLLNILFCTFSLVSHLHSRYYMIRRI